MEEDTETCNWFAAVFDFSTVHNICQCDINNGAWSQDRGLGSDGEGEK